MVSDLQRRILKSATESSKSTANTSKILTEDAVQQVQNKVQPRLDYLNNTIHVGTDYRAMH